MTYEIKTVTTSEREPMRQLKMRKLTAEELDQVAGGVSDLGKAITKAVDDAISAAVTR